jgi:O-antigen/teichoic acid export membrane protein
VKLLKNMLYSTAFQMLVILMPLITQPYISRVLQPTGVGINAYTASIVNYFILFGGLGISTYGNREIAYHQKDREERSRLFFELFALQLIAAIVAIVAYGIFIALMPQWRIFYLVQGIALIAAALDISWYFMGVENFRVIVVRNAIVKLVIVVLTFVLVKSPDDLWIYILLVVLSSLLGNLTVWPFLRKELIHIPWRKLKIWRHLKPTLLLFLPQIMISIYLSLNKTMLGAMDGVQSSGFFSESDMIVRTAFTLVTSFGAAFLPHLSNLLSESQNDRVKALVFKSLDLSNAISFLIMAGIMGVSQTFAVYFFGSAYKVVGSLMFVQSFMVIFVAWSLVLGKQYIMAARRNKELAVSYAIALVVNVIANFILIPVLGAMGAIIATVLTEVTVTVCQVWIVRDVFKLHELLRGVWKYFVAGVVTFGAVFLLDCVMPVNVGCYIVQAVVGMVAYGALLLVFHAAIVDEVKGFIQGFLAHRNTKKA